MEQADTIQLEGWKVQLLTYSTNSDHNKRHGNVFISQSIKKHMVLMCGAVVFGLSCPSGNRTPHPGVICSALCWTSTDGEPERGNQAETAVCNPTAAAGAIGSVGQCEVERFRG